MRISDWSSDVCSSDLPASFAARNIRPRTSASTPAASSLVSLVMAAAIGGAMMCRQPRSARKRPLPRLWLMTDERVDDETLLTAIRRLPQGSGIIFRHYTLPTNKRRLLFARVRPIAQRRRLVQIGRAHV